MVGRRGLHTLCGLASFREARCCWRVSLGLDVRSDMRCQLTKPGVITSVRFHSPFSRSMSDIDPIRPGFYHPRELSELAAGRATAVAPRQ